MADEDGIVFLGMRKKTFGGVIRDGSGAGDDEADDEIQYLGRAAPWETDDILYRSTIFPFKSATICHTNVTYKIYYSSNIHPNDDVGEVGDLCVLKHGVEGPAVFWKKQKASGKMSWKIKRGEDVVRFPKDNRITLQAGSSGPEWGWKKKDIEGNAAFAKAAIAFININEKGRTRDNPIDNIL